MHYLCILVCDGAVEPTLSDKLQNRIRDIARDLLSVLYFLPQKLRRYVHPPGVQPADSGVVLFCQIFNLTIERNIIMASGAVSRQNNGVFHHNFGMIPFFYIENRISSYYKIKFCVRISLL